MEGDSVNEVDSQEQGEPEDHHEDRGGPPVRAEPAFPIVQDSTNLREVAPMRERLYRHCRNSRRAQSLPMERADKRLLERPSDVRGAMGLSRTLTFPPRMKRDLMEILCCPVCKGDLELRVDVEKDEILEGSLFCKHCNHRYEIKDGIPDLLPPDFK